MKRVDVFYVTLIKVPTKKNNNNMVLQLKKRNDEIVSLVRNQVYTEM
jgi:hypothetical protein